MNDLGNQAMTALAKIHRIDWRRKTPYLGDPIPFEDDVVRWDRFYERAADPERLALVPQVRKRLLDRLPKDAPVGVFHGDFQTANLFCSTDRNTARGDRLGADRRRRDVERCGLDRDVQRPGGVAQRHRREAVVPRSRTR